MSITHRRTAAKNLLLFYPGESLTDQIGRWHEHRHRQRVVAAFERSMPKIRELLHPGYSALIDATKNPSLAADVLLQAIGKLGKNSVAVYSEAGHADTEIFARTQGVLFILGPLNQQHLAEFFERFLERKILVSPVHRPDAARLPLPLWLDRTARLRQWFTNRYGGNSDMPVGGMD